MKSDFPALWAESPGTLRREPTPTELAGGYPCGDLDLPLFNELAYRLTQVYREAAYAITASGQTPNQNNTTQLWQAIVSAAQAAAPNVPSSAYVHFGVDTGTSPGQIVANIAPDLPASVTGYPAGHLYIITAANNAVSGGTTANLDNRGARTVTRADGSAVQAGDYVTGEVITLVDDGARLQLAGVLTANIPSSNINISTASGTFTVPAGVTKIKRVRIWGPGGGGGGSTGTNGAGSGGGGGGYAEIPSYPVTPGSTLVITVGLAGQGGTNANGTSGGISSLGVQGQTAFIAATGGTFGSFGNNTPQQSASGNGGVGSGAGLNATGGVGSLAIQYGTVVGSGIGGAGAFGGGSPTPNVAVGSTPGNFPGGGANGGCGGSNGTAGGGGLVVFEY